MNAPTLMALMVCLLTLIRHTITAEPVGSSPNIIYILADDLGYGDLGCYGQQTLRTPRIDAMAKEGMRFTQHYAGSTICAPSRCVLLTGYHTGHARIRGNDRSLLRPWDTTVAQLLKKAGYQTGCMGKWGVGHPPPLNNPAQHGFDDFYGYINMYHAHNFYPEWLVENGRRVPLRNRIHPEYRDPEDRQGWGVAYQKVDYAPDHILDRAVRFLEANRNRRFFLYLPLNQPHANNEAGNDARSPGHGLETPHTAEFEEQSWPESEKGFATMIGQIDQTVGKILDTVTRLGLREETLVFFSSDNGPHQEGNHLMEFFDSNGSLRGMKRDLYEGGIRVPLIAWWPGHVAANAQNDLLSGFQDIFPTLAEAAGIAYPNTDGLSLLPTLLGEPGQRHHDSLYWETHERHGIRALRKGFWKAIQHHFLREPEGSVELYDLSIDPKESKNIASDHAIITSELKRLMDLAHEPRNDPGH